MTSHRNFATALIALGFFCGAVLPSAAATAPRQSGLKKAIVVVRPAAKPAAPAARRSKPIVLRLSRKLSPSRPAVAMRIEPARLSFGQVYGLHSTADALDLKSSVALVVDQDTNEVLFSKNPQAVLPIASLTKLMTALVVAEARLPLDEFITITEDDVDTEKFSRSRLRVGTSLSRGEMLHLALMSSENRAAHALGRHYPGGVDAFITAMNRKARSLGMADTHYVEPTGLSSGNQSSARDLAALVRAAHEHQIIRDLSTSPEYRVDIGNRSTEFRTTNALVNSPSWEIGLQKTGYISEAGRCLVMQARMAGRHVIMVFLDSVGKYSRIGDAERVRRWLTETPPGVAPATLGLTPKLAG